MRAGNTTWPDSGLDAALCLLAGKWKAHILWELRPDHLRFGELRRRLAGVSDKVLSEKLRQLEADGIVRRESLATSYGPVQRQVRYSLTPRGASLADALLPVRDWGARYLTAVAEN
ncbi:MULTISPECIES: helix-turn-helix domain-containing protein [unclassified Streptomyces]|uniref:winged helix-turn-helix transcriptional regulator n=1 Tax=unclassified Streptomyces TaxID=2593676 RepID=UPI00332D1943